MQRQNVGIWDSNNQVYWLHSELSWNYASGLDFCTSNQPVIFPGNAEEGPSCEQSAGVVNACVSTEEFW